jgi:Uma2 family endonuclease
MNLLHQPRLPEPGAPQQFLLQGTNWQTYEKVLEAIGDRPIRVTYDRGNLELLSPSPIHEIYKRLFGRLLDVLAEELDVYFKACGSTTFRREDLDRGLEPDECFYLACGARVRDWRTIDLTQDPPPDLAIEIDITSSSLNRMGIYAALGVPELWRFDGETLQVYQLGVDGAYSPRPHSLAFPLLPLAEVVSLLQQSVAEADDRVVLKALRTWVRERVVPLARERGTQDSPEPSG